MLGRIRASSSSLDSLDGSPSKILKDDSLSVYEATLMKLKLGAQRDISAHSREIDEIMNDYPASSSCIEEANLKPYCNASSPPTASGSDSQHITTSPSDGITMMETDYCSSISTSPSFSDHVSDGNSGQRRKNNVSILRFYKFKDPGNSSVSSCVEAVSTKDGSSASVSTSAVESHYTSEMGRIQSLQDCELSVCHNRDTFMTGSKHGNGH